MVFLDRFNGASVFSHPASKKFGTCRAHQKSSTPHIKRVRVFFAEYIALIYRLGLLHPVQAVDEEGIVITPLGLPVGQI
jgi:hypothetical protein